MTLLANDELDARRTESASKLRKEFPGLSATNRKTGRRYTIAGIALDSGTLEPVVVYGCGYGWWTRALDEFLSKFSAVEVKR